MVVERDDDDMSEASNFSPVSAEVLERVKKRGGIVFPLRDESNKLTGNVNIAANTVESIIKRPLMEFTASQKYVYGPSVNLDAIEINKRDYPVRQFDPKHLLINSEGDGVGSCPYLYTYSPEKDAWLNEGVILYGINEKSKESNDARALRRFDGRVLIREKDDEQSFIDSISVRAIGADGAEIILYPENENLRLADGNYLKLKQGDQVIVNFELPKNFIARKYILEARGYYIPTKVKSEQRLRPFK